MQNVKVFHCDFTKQDHVDALCMLMNAYITDNMGGGTPLDTSQQKELVKGLAEHPTSVVLLATVDDSFAGLTNCFVNFGTFAVKKFINIHDVIVLKEHRGKGVGKKIMEAVIEHARNLNCAKITLEVRKDNEIAQQLYRTYGFDECNPPMHFWDKKL